MHKAKKGSAGQGSFVYEVRSLPNRWTEPQAGPVISTHSSARAAQDAFEREPQSAADGTGRSTYGSYVAKAIVRVDADGRESMMLAPPIAGSGLVAWPYSN